MDEPLDSWADTRRGVIAEVENISGSRLAFRPSTDVRSVAELVQHVVEGALMWSGELSDPNGDFTRQDQDFVAFIKEYADQTPRRHTKASLLQL